MKRTAQLIMMFILGLLLGAPRCSPKAQQDFPKVNAGDLLASPPISNVDHGSTESEPPAQADVKPQGNSKPFEQSATMLNLLATLCLEDGKVNNECLDASIECAIKVDPALPGALQKMRDCAKKGLEGK